MSTGTIRFMGVAEPERVRCRVYARSTPAEKRREAERVAFLRLLATDGALDAPAYDRWIDALRAKGWLSEPVMEEVPGGYTKRWRLNDVGRSELKRVEAAQRADLLAACGPKEGE